MFKRFIPFGFVLVSLCIALASCGIKPGAVDPPPGAEDRVFPRTYPDPATGPAP